MNTLPPPYGTFGCVQLNCSSRCTILQLLKSFSKHVFLLLMLLALSMPAVAQRSGSKAKIGSAEAKPEKTIKSCYILEDLCELTSMPVNKQGDIRLNDFLRDYYNIVPAHERHAWIDTVDGIEMSYTRHTYVKVSEDHGAQKWFYVYESHNGLPNIIDFKISRTVCGYNFEQEITNLYFGTQILGDIKVFSGSLNGDSIEIRYVEIDDYYITYRLKCANPIKQFVSKKREEYKSIVNEAIEKAERYADHHFYHKAYQVLDSCKGIYTPMDATLASKRNQIRRTHCEHLRQELEYQVNREPRNLAQGISLCDTILSLDGGDSTIARIRDILIMSKNKQYQLYSDFSPEGYNKVVEMMEHMVNREIKRHRYSYWQTLTLDFTFNVDSLNNSFGTMKVETDKRLFGGSKRELEARNESLKQQTDSLAAHPLIKPMYLSGINFDIYQQLTAKVRWISNEAICDETQFPVGMDKYMSDISKDYFMVLNTRTNKYHESKPTKYEYTFSVTQKWLDTAAVGSDILLTDFKTSNAFSWMPSLLVPGLGTEIQGVRESAWSRAFPFYLFGLISAAGFYIDGHDFSNSTSNFGKLLSESGYIGKIMAYGGLAIAGSIYVTDLVQAIKGTVNNLSRSKKLRKRLAEGPIEMTTTDIRLR